MTEQYLPADRFAEGEFRIGRVLGRAWLLLARNSAKLLLIMLIAWAPLLLAPAIAPDAPPANQFQNLRAGWLPGLLFVVLAILCHAPLMHSASRAMSGRVVNLTEAFRVSFCRFFPLIGLGFIVLVIILLVMVAIFLAGGGLIASVAGVWGGLGEPARNWLTFAGVFTTFVIMLTLDITWFVSSPACVIEGLGPLGSLERSRELTRGNRWKLFGLLLVTLVVAILVGAVVFAVVFATVGFAKLPALPALISTTPARVINALFNVIWATYFGLVIFVAYHDLRVAKEGIGTEQIAKVFE